MQLVVREQGAGPFLSQVLTLARAEQQLSAEQLQQIKSKAVLMSLKFADKFYNKYKMHLLEQAAHDVIGITSLGLQALSDGDARQALTLLLSPEGVVKSFQKGWSMLVNVSFIDSNNRSLYGDVEEKLIQNISSPPDAYEWKGWMHYKNALADSNRRKVKELLIRNYFSSNYANKIMKYSGIELLQLDSVLAEIILYKAFFNNEKVSDNIRERLKHATIPDNDNFSHFIKNEIDTILYSTPPDLSKTIKSEIGSSFLSELLITKKFCSKYQNLMKTNPSPKKLCEFEEKARRNSILIGLPL